MSVKLIHSETVDGEKRWTYSIFITFNNQTITSVTITDHTWKKASRRRITEELILNILQVELDKKRFSPIDYEGKRKVFVRDEIDYQNKKHRLIFWFKDGTTNHLWIRNCYLINISIINKKEKYLSKTNT
ncbi:MAG: hypothetical protein I3273_01090 [Candidatus Moeniiplasma glomeromycotorum]|nr:hypothetical protein [Candidatus Moeniiplasma glomeromycotorum]MCE8167283.1 hypothetical protein [Candidatus Moeniiplasma glomeromycotorum]MCE8168704.1 hypothetical protein [Candidatus Moeniiplasma glomeromycotorum]